MTTKEYTELYKKYPFYNEYDGYEEDKNKIIEFNKELINKYPWVIPRNRWTGDVVENYDYSYTEIDSVPNGWRIAFGDNMIEEIHQELLKAQENDPQGGYREDWITTNYDSDKIIPYVDGFRLEEIKEKYGELRIYCNGAPSGVHDVINKYENLSKTICINCGNEAIGESKGWISPYCDKCAHEMFDEEEDYAKKHYSSYTPSKFENCFTKLT